VGEEASDKSKIMSAFAKGAAAVMLYSPDSAPAGGAFMMGPMGPRGEALDPAAFTRPFLAVTSVDDSVFRWIMWRDPQESQRGFSARFAALRADIKAKKARSAATGVTAVAQGLRHGYPLRRAVQRTTPAGTSSPRSRARSRR